MIKCKDEKWRNDFFSTNRLYKTVHLRRAKVTLPTTHTLNTLNTASFITISARRKQYMTDSAALQVITYREILLSTPTVFNYGDSDTHTNTVGKWNVKLIDIISRSKRILNWLMTEGFNDNYHFKMCFVSHVHTAARTTSNIRADSSISKRIEISVITSSNMVCGVICHVN